MLSHFCKDLTCCCLFLPLAICLSQKSWQGQHLIPALSVPLPHSPGKRAARVSSCWGMKRPGLQFLPRLEGWSLTHNPLHLAFTGDWGGSLGTPLTSTSISFPLQPTSRLGKGLGPPLLGPPTPIIQPPTGPLGWWRGWHSALTTPYPAGFGRENTWIGLNDRIVERDFQWTDNTGLVSCRSLSLCCPAAD